MPQGTRSFATEEWTLLDLWCHIIRDIPVSDDEQGEKYVENVFTDEGYRVIR